MRRLQPLLPLLFALSMLPACSSATDEASTTTILVSTGRRTVAVHVLVDGEARGWQVGGILMPGTSTYSEDAVGGFAADLDDNAGGLFETFQTVRTPAFGINDVPDDLEDRPPFPYVTDQVLLVEPGLYTMIVHIGNGDLDNLLYPKAPGGESFPETAALCEYRTLVDVQDDHDAVVNVEFDLAFPASFNCLP